MTTKQPDWEAIERAYRAGVLSVREIAASCGVSHTVIQKRAKANGWERDLKAKIKAKADSLVAKREVATQVASKSVETEREIIEVNAEVIANIRMAHRGDISRCRSLTNKLLDELESGVSGPCKVGVLAVMTESGEVKAFGFGPAADDLQSLALFRLGEQKLIDVLLESAAE
ncbi:hypothetical protein [Pseudomonas sp. GL-B-16]|uniref:hypothetical protein n=1 Tax=Pseudomonas sp. GL-B-16 TaxID=2832373 RepID=UPI001CBE9A27|nr:hypothetical protein [Pseudomonas sp. GL-B-16]